MGPICVHGLGTVNSDSLSVYNRMLTVENTKEGREYRFYFNVLPAHGTSITDSDYWNHYFPLYRLLTLGIISVSYMKYRCCIFIVISVIFLNQICSSVLTEV